MEQHAVAADLAIHPFGWLGTPAEILTGNSIINVYVISSHAWTKTAFILILLSFMFLEYVYNCNFIELSTVV